MVPMPTVCSSTRGMALAVKARSTSRLLAVVPPPLSSQLVQRYLLAEVCPGAEMRRGRRAVEAKKAAAAGRATTLRMAMAKSAKRAAPAERQGEPRRGDVRQAAAAEARAEVAPRGPLLGTRPLRWWT